MRTDRMSTFSDGVIAILITIMVLDLHPTVAVTGPALRHRVLPTFLAYVLSFVNLGIYWNNHHHLLQLVDRVTGGILWANLHLLFWLSLFPFTTAWMGEHHFATLATAVYGIVLLGAALAYYVLQALLVRAQGPGSELAAALGRDVKGKLSPALYCAGIATSYVSRWVGVGFYVVVALMWLIPDRRIEGRLAVGSDGVEQHGGPS
jgi:uncharacterized membrane protein